jgi:hypothetical protein
MDDTRELIIALIDRAKSGEHTKFEQLRFFDDYAGARVIYSATRKVVATLEHSANNLFKNYCKAVKQQQADVNLLLAYKQLQLAISFYKEEVRIIKDILADYETYLCEGNFIKAFVFGEARNTWNQR